MGEIVVTTYLMTCLWAGMECADALLLFDGFSERKFKRSACWFVCVCVVILNAAVLNSLDSSMTSFGKILYTFAVYILLHTILYRGDRIFFLYIVAIYYATICCIDNLCATFLFVLFDVSDAIDLSSHFAASFVIHCLSLAVFYLHKRMRKSTIASTANRNWYSVPALLSLASIFLIFFFGDCFQQIQISALPLFVCACFITIMQIAALFLVS